MTITRVGTNQKYAVGWESAFTKKKPAKAAATKKKAASPKKKAAGKTKKK